MFLKLLGCYKIEVTDQIILIGCLPVIKKNLALDMYK